MPTRVPVTFAMVLRLTLITTSAQAQIYQWSDATGTRHFSNSVASLSKEGTEAAEIFIDEIDTPETSDAATTPTDAPPAPQNSEIEDHPLHAGDVATRVQEVVIVEPQPAPVVLVQSPPPLVISVPNDPSGLYYQSPYRGTVTVPFDRGRSRGLTRRQQLHDLIQLDRQLR